MCYFITIGLPDDKAECLEQHVPRGFHIAPIANQSVLQQMGQRLRTYLLMRGGCSCQLFSRPSAETDGDRQARQQAVQEHRRHKYEKMGWSPAKIDRALAQRPKGRVGATFTGLHGDVQRFLAELVLKTGQLAVLVHWYEEDLQDGRIVCRQGDTVSPQTLIEERLSISEDEIARVRTRD